MGFEVRNFLSDRQQKTFDSLLYPLQKSLEENLQSEQDDRIQVVRNVLDVAYSCRDELSAIHYSRYFTLILSSREGDDLNLTTQLVKIAERGLSDQFFSSAWTKVRSPTRQLIKSQTGQFFNKTAAARLEAPPMPSFSEMSFQQFYVEVNKWLLTQPANTLSLQKIKNQEKFGDRLKIALATIILKTKPMKESDIEKILDMASEICVKYGEQFLTQVMKGFNDSLYLSDVMAVFTYLSSIDNDELFDVVDQFSDGIINLNQFKQILSEKMPIHQIASNVEDKGIDDLISRLQTDPAVKMQLSDELLKKIRGQYFKIEEYCESWKKCTSFQLIQMAKEISEKEEDEDLEKLVALGRLSLFHFQKKFLYSTQIFAVLGILAGNQSTIAQVKTGEGKSLIIGLLAFVLAMRKRAVDVISSSPSLAMRDAAKFKPFFAQFDLVANHICHKEPQPEHFKGHILYGTPSDFEFAIMREQLYFSEFFKHRPRKSFDAVIVDEADNLTIDTQLNAARLSVTAPFSYEWVYSPLYKALVEDPDLSVDSLRNLLLTLEEGRYASIANSLKDEQILTWKHSALQANNAKEFKDYVIRHQNNGPVVVIVDKDNTGQLKWGSRWTNGVHEFLEVKHHIPVQKESLTPLSMSHIVFYQKYQSIFGLTGTLGSEQERAQIATAYKVSLFDVPYFRPCIRDDLRPMIYCHAMDYHMAIYKNVTEMMRKGRPVLIICETIDDSIAISNRLREHDCVHQLFNEMQQEDEEDIIEKAGDVGRVTVTTNNAGRGTDIILKSESIQNGGLHVILTFYPNSLRVEEQAIGRAGRQGQPGSSQMIIWHNHLHLVDFFSLGLSRQLKEIQMAAYCEERAIVEQFSQPMVEQFYQQLGKFKNKILSTHFTRKFSIELASYFLFSLPNYPEPTHREDRLLKDKITSLILNRELDEVKKAAKRTKWEELLESIGKRIIGRCIEEWTISFFQKVEEINISSSCAHEEKTKNISSLFASVCDKWDRYLKKPETGVVLYIKELSGADFSDILK